MKVPTEGVSAAIKAAKGFAALAGSNRQELVRALKGVPPTQLLQKVAVGAPVGIAALTALPVFGAVGILTATGVAVGATIGALAAVTEEVLARRDAAPKDENEE